MKKIEWNKKNIISATVIGLALLGLGIGTAAYGYYRMGPNSVANAQKENTQETTAITEEATAVTTAQEQVTTTVITVAPEQQAQGNNNAVANNKTTQGVKKTQAQQKNNSGGYNPAPSSPTKAATPTTKPTTAKPTTAKPTTATPTTKKKYGYYVCKGCGYKVRVSEGSGPIRKHCEQRRLEGYPCGGYYSTML